MARSMSKIPARHQNKPRVRLKVKIKKDDTVKVIAGRDKGKTGRVLHVDRETGKVLVEGVSLVKRHTRPNPSRQIKGGIAERESPIAISNPLFEESKREVTTACRTSGFPPKIACPIATRKAMRKSAAQIQLSTARRMRAAESARQGWNRADREGLAHVPRARLG